jgi:hypothetical protein
MTAAGTATARAAMLIGLMRELEQVMQAEIAVVGSMKLDRLSDLQREKGALAEAYERALREFRSEPLTAAQLDPEARASLREAMRAFQASAGANAKRLLAAHKVVEGIVRALGEAANGAVGGRYAGRAAGGGQVIPLALSRQV